MQPLFRAGLGEHRLTAASARKPAGSYWEGGLSGDNPTVAGHAIDQAVEIVGFGRRCAVAPGRLAREAFVESVRGHFGQRRGEADSSVEPDFNVGRERNALRPESPDKLLLVRLWRSLF